MTQELFPYQLEAAQALATKKSQLLWYEMGLGKTAIAITAADFVGAVRILVVCPAVAIENWQREFERFGRSGNGRVLSVSSYHSLHHVPSAEEFDLLILDEAQFLKTPAAERTQQIYGQSGIARRAKRVWLLSGTPTPNNVSEWWIHLFCLGYTRLSFRQFTEQFCVGRVLKIPGAPPRFQITGNRVSAYPELRKILEPFVMRKTKAEVLKLPPITFEQLVVKAGDVNLQDHKSFIEYVTPFDRSKALFDDMEKQTELLKTFLSTVPPNSHYANEGLQSMEHSLSTLRRFIGLQKVEPTIKFVTRELEDNEYEKLVIFAVHRDVVEALRIGLEKFGVVTLYGGTPPAKRQKHIDGFQRNKKIRVFIANIHAAGTAITLTAAHDVLFVETTWTPSDMAQALMRCHRIGQKHSVHVRTVSLYNSIDEKITQTVQRKVRELSALYGQGEVHYAHDKKKVGFPTPGEILAAEELEKL